MALLSLSLLMKQDNETINSALEVAKTEVKMYADVQDFINLKPIIGIDGETKLTLSINGLNATLPEKIIFLGGYCSTLPTQTIALNPSTTNYIYLIRNRDDRHVIDVMNRNTAIGVEGENAFNRILVAKLITNTNSVTSTVYFPV